MTVAALYLGLGILLLLIAYMLVRELVIAIARRVSQQTITIWSSHLLAHCADMGMTEKEAAKLISETNATWMYPLKVTERQLRWKFSNNPGLTKGEHYGQ